MNPDRWNAWFLSALVRLPGGVGPGGARFLLRRRGRTFAAPRRWLMTV